MKKSTIDTLPGRYDTHEHNIGDKYLQ